MELDTNEARWGCQDPNHPEPRTICATNKVYRKSLLSLCIGNKLSKNMLRKKFIELATEKARESGFPLPRPIYHLTQDKPIWITIPASIDWKKEILSVAHDLFQYSGAKLYLFVRFKLQLIFSDVHNVHVNKKLAPAITKCISDGFKVPFMLQYHCTLQFTSGTLVGLKIFDSVLPVNIPLGQPGESKTDYVEMEEPCWWYPNL